MNEKLKAGTIKAQVQQEDIIWYDRKRVTIFALPWSFTRYKLTDSRLLVEEGLFTLKEEEIRLYRISDISYSQTLYERISNTGTLKITSNDSTTPTIELKHIKNAKTVKDVLSQAVEDARKKSRVRTSEMIGDIQDINVEPEICEESYTDCSCTDN